LGFQHGGVQVVVSGGTTGINEELKRLNFAPWFTASTAEEGGAGKLGGGEIAQQQGATLARAFS
jgi:hypothetical protein